MRFFHLADLHIGKILNGFSLLEDQRHVFAQILELAAEKKPRAVVLAGDIYDKPTPTGEAVQLFDELLVGLSRLNIPVLIISGNHDSPARLDFAGRILQQQGIHLYSRFEGAARQVELDGVVFHLLPFIKPAQVRPLFPGAAIESYQQAVEAALAASPPDPARPSVLVTHQFVATPGQQPEESESELRPVGGIDVIDGRIFEAFDYVALGHLHGPQRIGRDSMRYAGSPLKYSLSERDHHKSLAMVELGGKGQVAVELLPLAPWRDLRRLVGTADQLADAAQKANAEDYVYAVLTNQDEVVDALGRLRAVYPNLLGLEYDNLRSAALGGFEDVPQVEGRDPAELFADFFARQNGAPPSPEQMAVVAALLNETEGRP